LPPRSWKTNPASDPEINYAFTDGPHPGTWTGLAGPEVWHDWLSAWDDFAVEGEEYRELDGERILVISRATARGKASGVEVAQRRANIFHIQDGKVTRLVLYWDHSRAPTDLGLTPEDG